MKRIKIISIAGARPHSDDLAMLAGKSEFEKNDVDKIDEKNNMEKSNFSSYEIKNGIDVTGWYFAA
ncbi:MAG: hypothetical protein NC931_05820, partial [Candidatus Omnitrophica bacterium]|nr:hypothetical protein [Candidatus Omnitrophota bacterium]